MTLQRTSRCGGHCPPWGDVMGWLWAGMSPWVQGLGQASGLSPPGIDALKEKPLALPGSPEPQPRVKEGFAGWQLPARAA